MWVDLVWLPSLDARLTLPSEEAAVHLFILSYPPPQVGGKETSTF